MEVKYFKKIAGQKCYLSPMSVDDAEKYTEWLNDFSVTVTLNTVDTILSVDKERDELKALARGYNFSIIDSKTNKVIGSGGFFNVDLVNKNAEFGLFIGDKTFWNRGYGTEASQLLLDFGFNVLNLYHVSLKVFDFNHRAIKCYEKVGFQNVGKFTEIREIAGKRYDMYFMEILAKNFTSPYIKKAFDELQHEKLEVGLKVDLI